MLAWSHHLKWELHLVLPIVAREMLGLVTELWLLLLHVVTIKVLHLPCVACIGEILLVLARLLEVLLSVLWTEWLVVRGLSSVGLVEGWWGEHSQRSVHRWSGLICCARCLLVYGARCWVDAQAVTVLGYVLWCCRQSRVS